MEKDKFEIINADSLSDEALGLRLMEIRDVRMGWDTAAKEWYGKDVAGQLKEIAPSDPMILHDLSVSSFMQSDGMTQEEAEIKTDHFSHEDWQTEFDGFKNTITTLADRAIRNNPA